LERIGSSYKYFPGQAAEPEREAGSIRRLSGIPDYPPAMRYRSFLWGVIPVSFGAFQKKWGNKEHQE